MNSNMVPAESIAKNSPGEKRLAVQVIDWWAEHWADTDESGIYNVYDEPPQFVMTACEVLGFEYYAEATSWVIRWQIFRTAFTDNDTMSRSMSGYSP